MTNDGPACPACKSLCNSTIYKEHIQLLKCFNCGVIFNNTHKTIDYNDSYFTTQYKEQYGRTYKEDFENIYNISLCRLNRISKYFNFNKNRAHIKLIDIGSAMGFFLKAAQDAGIKDITGIEISKFAAAYCREQFRINVINSSFHEAKLNGMFDIITAWYFLEHCRDPLATVKKIYNHLNNNGIFAFSMPSVFGPLYIFNRNEWYKTHPEDHRIDFSPNRIKKFLKKIGFSEIKIYPGGIHPERLIRERSFIFKPFKAIYRGISGIFRFSDTIEIFAVK